MGLYRKTSSFNKKWYKYEICSSEQELFRYFDNGGINGGRTTLDSCKSADLTKKHEKMLIIVATGRVIIGKHTFSVFLMAALMAAGFWNICGMTSIPIYRLQQQIWGKKRVSVCGFVCLLRAAISAAIVLAWSNVWNIVSGVVWYQNYVYRWDRSLSRHLTSIKVRKQLLEADSELEMAKKGSQKFNFCDPFLTIFTEH